MKFTDNIHRYWDIANNHPILLYGSITIGISLSIYFLFRKNKLVNEKQGKLPSKPPVIPPQAPKVNREPISEDSKFKPRDLSPTKPPAVTKKNPDIIIIENLKEGGKPLDLKEKLENPIPDKLKSPVSKPVLKLQVPRKTLVPYFEGEHIEVITIQSLPDPNKSEPKRIGYLPSNEFTQQEPFDFGIVKMPKINSLIKFPRKGRSNKKGYKEDEFYTDLNKYFNNHFTILNDRHLPTGCGRPYEPDFVLINEKDNKNIFINIEIDEPYDGWLRTPTHCIKDSEIRDSFFTNRGWVVIRFAEIQIHQDPVGCCAFITRVIRSIDESFDSSLLTHPIPIKVQQWDDLQAKKWALARYREKYLGIDGFGKRSNIITEYEIFDSEIDQLVEKTAPKQKGLENKLNGKDILSKKNKDGRDKRISFDPIEHRYFIDGNPDTISVTQLIDKFFPEFDSPYWAPIKASQRGISTEAILAEWEAKRDNSAKKGTALHEAIEYHYNDNTYIHPSIEFEQFLAFKKKYSSMNPYRTEWRIFDEDLLVAGTVDMVYKKEDGTLFIFDWKRSEKVVNPDGSIKNTTFQSAFGEIGHLGDNSYNKYCLQQNIYKAILEKRYKQKVSSMNLLIMHEVYDRYHIIQIPDMRKEVNHIFNHAFCLK